jgi:hypothetical protein
MITLSILAVFILLIGLTLERVASRRPGYRPCLGNACQRVLTPLPKVVMMRSAPGGQFASMRDEIWVIRRCLQT